MSIPIEIKSDSGSPAPGQYTQGCVVARGVTLTVLTPHPPAERREARHGSNQRLANSDHIGFHEELLEPLPVLFVRQRVDVRSH